LYALTAFQVDNNQVKGTMPTEIGKLTRLYSLLIDFGSNSMGRILPTEIGKLTALNDVLIEKVQSPGTSIPTEIGKCTDLEYFGLWDVELGGTLPSELGGALTTFELYGLGGVRGTIPTEVGNMGNLKEAYFSVSVAQPDLSLSGTLPTEIGRMRQELESFYVYGAPSIGGSLPTEIGMMASLTDLYLRVTDVGGYIPTELARIMSNDAIYRKLNGELIPGSGGNLTSLDVANNRLSGTLPTEFARVTDGSKSCTFSDPTSPGIWSLVGIDKYDNFLLPSDTARYNGPVCQVGGYASPPSPPPAGDDEPSEGKNIEGEIGLGAEAGACKLNSFLDGVKVGLARALGVSRKRVLITGCRSGSVIVSFTVQQVTGEYTDSIEVEGKLADPEIQALVANYVAANTGATVLAGSIKFTGVSNFGFDPPPPPSPPPASPPPALPPVGAQSSLTDGQIAGITIGTILGCCCLVGAAYAAFYFGIKNKQADDQTAAIARA